jgi:uncharacterized protein (DUF779 family)
LRLSVFRKEPSEDEMPAPARVEASAETLLWIARLREKHGPLMFYQHHGCCQGGAAPVCLPEGEYRLGDSDVLLGEIGGCAFYMSGWQFEQWRNIQTIIDVAPGQGSGFSVEAPEGVCFFTRLRVFTDAEVALLAEAGAPLSVGSLNGLYAEATYSKLR